MKLGRSRPRCTISLNSSLNNASPKRVNKGRNQPRNPILGRPASRRSVTTSLLGKPDLPHGVFKEEPIFRCLHGLSFRADISTLYSAWRAQPRSSVRSAANGRQEQVRRSRLMMASNSFVSGSIHARFSQLGMDRRRIVHQRDFVPFFAQGLTGLRTEGIRKPARSRSGLNL